MTIITKELFKIQSSRNRTCERIREFHICDDCECSFERIRLPCCQTRSVSGLTFCTLKCRTKSRKPGGKLYAHYTQVVDQRFGTHPFNLVDRNAPETKAKRQQTNLEKYGFDHPWKSPDVRKQAQATCFDRHGWVSPFQVPEIQARTIEKLKNDPSVGEKRKATCRERYDVDYVLQLPTTKMNAHSQKANEKRIKTVMSSPEHRAHSSKKEKQFLEFLQSVFIDVQTRVRFPNAPNNRWIIDFYISDINVYVQFDGVYWHGLDRSFEDLQTSQSSRDKKILEKYMTDRRQDEWTQQNKIKLCRVTDIEFESLSTQAIIDKIKSTL